MPSRPYMNFFTAYGRFSSIDEFFQKVENSEYIIEEEDEKVPKDGVMSVRNCFYNDFSHKEPSTIGMVIPLPKDKYYMVNNNCRSTVYCNMHEVIHFIHAVMTEFNINHKVEIKHDAALWSYLDLEEMDVLLLGMDFDEDIIKKRAVLTLIRHIYEGVYSVLLKGAFILQGITGESILDCLAALTNRSEETRNTGHSYMPSGRHNGFIYSMRSSYINSDVRNLNSSLTPIVKGFKDLLPKEPKFNDYLYDLSLKKSISDADFNKELLGIIKSGLNKTKTILKLIKQEKMDKIKVYVVGGSIGYARWIENRVLVDDIKDADVVMFTGGEDINPSLYGAEPHESVYFNDERDQLELDAYKNCPKHAVKLGICRGGQLLTALAGGLLVQDVNNHGIWGCHEMTLNGDESYEITSLHHQMFYLNLMPMKDYRIVGYTKPRSTKYLGLPKDANNPNVEPEVVFYDKINAFAIQGHPEMMDTNHKTVKEFNRMLNQYIIRCKGLSDEKEVLDGYIKFDKIGSDPEFLIADANGKFISSDGIILGTKSEPLDIPSLGEGFAIQVDNVLGEFNVPAAKTREQFVDNMMKMKGYINDFLSPKGLHAVHLASAHYDRDQLETEVAQLFGCDPDYCVWTRSQNRKPRMDDPTLRSTGCHIHVSYKKDGEDIKRAEIMVKAMDLFLGVPSIILDKDKERRKLYGKAGCFRIQKWGVEYRTLSGFFLKDEETIAWCYDQTMKAINFINRNGYKRATAILDGEKEAIQNCINNGDEAAAKGLILKYNV